MLHNSTQDDRLSDSNTRSVGCATQTQENNHDASNNKRAALRHAAGNMRYAGQSDRAMSAFVEHSFDRGFLLDEPKLRKLHELVTARLSRLPTPVPLSFKIYRGDSYSYETEAVEDVIGEENEDWRAITRLDLTASVNDVLHFHLFFSGRYPSLRIVGDDRDTVFLLFSDVREYMTNEVLGARVIDEGIWRFGGYFFAMFLMIGSFFWVQLQTMPSPEQTAAALSSADLSVKVDFLIQERARREVLAWAFFGATTGALLIMLLATAGTTGRIWKVLFPTNLFLFGARKATFEARRRLLEKIFWVVIVGTVVSILAGFVVWLSTRQ